MLIAVYTHLHTYEPSPLFAPVLTALSAKAIAVTSIQHIPE